MKYLLLLLFKSVFGKKPAPDLVASPKYHDHSHWSFVCPGCHNVKAFFDPCRRFYCRDCKTWVAIKWMGIVHLLILLVCPSPAWADNLITLGWDPVADAEGYKLYWGVSADAVTNFMDVGTNLMSVFAFPPTTQLNCAVTAYDSGGESDLSALVTTNFVAMAPKIAVQPQPTTNAIGQTAMFSVTVSNITPLLYQWKFQGTNLPAGTNATYSFPVVVKSQAGLYSVSITNSVGHLDSAKAKLTIP